MTTLNAVQQHYSHVMNREVILAAVAAAGKNPDRLEPEDLALFDQLHTSRQAATERMIAKLAPTSGQHVLDVGCGLGGPARQLAKATGCRVTGIDLTPGFVETAVDFTRRTGQTATVAFQQGSATALPFADGSFDAAWHIHMSMNVADKPAMYAEIFRVLKPGARFAFYDPIRGEADEVAYPVPWAETSATSFLLRRTDMLALVEKSGFRCIEATDATKDGLAWFEAQARAQAEGKAPLQPPPAPRFLEMSKNHRRNMQVGAVAVLRAVFTRP